MFLRVDPRAALAARPQLWPIVDEVLAGGQTEMSDLDWRELSAFEHAAKRVMVSTIRRSEAAPRG